MKIQTVTARNYSPRFGNALSSKQEKEYLKLREEAQKLQGKQDGLRVVKLYTPALPYSDSKDMGIGKINSPEAKRFYEIAKVYGGANMIKFMPLGELSDKSIYSDNKYPGAYSRGAFTIGEDVIDITQLASAKYGNILSNEDVKRAIEQHRNKNIPENTIDFETTLGWTNQESYPINEYLRIAFENFNNIQNPNSNLIKLRKEFDEFKIRKTPVNYDDIYTRLALFPYLKDWSNARTDFFVGFDSNERIRAERLPVYEEYKREHAYDIDFFKFKQFLAHKALQEAKKTINDLGMDLQGDCPATFSWAEEQVFPDAFLRDKNGIQAELGWGIHVLNCNDLLHKEDSPAHKLLKAKVAHYLTNYDGIRFDVGWFFMNPSFHWSYGKYEHLNARNKITNFIENTAREIKGSGYDLKKLMYECDANAQDFNLWSNVGTIKGSAGLAILSTEDEKNDQANIGWGNLAFYKYNIGLHDDDFILGTNNHDKEGVLRCAKNKAKSSEQVGALLRVFNLGKADYTVLKDDKNLHEHIKKYTRARFAEPALAKHSFILYTDLLGREEKVDYHTNGTGHNGQIDYKNRLERNYEENFHRAIQDGVGYNDPDIQSFRMEIDHSKWRLENIYNKLRKYALYLQAKSGIYTREQADNSPLGNLDIGSMSDEEIKNLNYFG